jgi:hypothetical protein
MTPGIAVYEERERQSVKRLDLCLDRMSPSSDSIMTALQTLLHDLANHDQVLVDAISEAHAAGIELTMKYVAKCDPYNISECQKLPNTSDGA